MAEPTLDDYLQAIAKAEAECPCIYSGTLCTACTLRNEEQPNSEFDECPLDCCCHGTGRVQRFPELRAECPIPLSNPTRVHTRHGSCHGLGFVPLWDKPEDWATWIRVLSKAIKAIGYSSSYGDALDDGAILGVLKAAVRVLGITVREDNHSVKPE